MAEKKKGIASLGKKWYLIYQENKALFPLIPIIVILTEVNGMSKSQDVKKDKKTPPSKTPKEKKLAKKEKKNK